MLTALGTVAVTAGGKLRPMQRIDLLLPVPAGVFTVAALLHTLTAVYVDWAMPCWLDEWTGTQEMASPFPLLRELQVSVEIDDIDDQAAPRPALPFLKMTGPIELLNISTGHPLTFTAAAIAQLARCSQLQELDFSTGIFRASTFSDWTDRAQFASCKIGCPSHMREVTLQSVKVGVEAVWAIAYASPKL